MSSLRKRDEFKFPILSKEMMLRDAESQKPGEIKVYYLSPEELEKYRKGVNDMPAQIPIPSREEMIELIKFCKGSINAMAKAKRVGWNTIQRWLDHYGLREEAALMQAKVRLEKHNQQRENGTDAEAVTPRITAAKKKPARFLYIKRCHSSLAFFARQVILAARRW